MSKGTPSKGKHNNHKTHIPCRRCGKHSFHARKGECASCGHGKTNKMRNYAWAKTH